MTTRKTTTARASGSWRERLTTMTPVVVVDETPVPADRVLAAAHDFSARRAELWRDVHPEHLTVHRLGETSAEVTEGNPWPLGTMWERLRYDWSEPGVVHGTVTDSNIFRPGSTWQLRAEPAGPATRVEVRGVRRLRGQGLLLAPLFPLGVARRDVAAYLRQFLESLEREDGATASRRRPPRSWPHRNRSPRELAAALEARADVPDVPDRERLRGYAVTGLPFRSGHVLAMRRIPATSIGPAYTSLWHRDPAGRLVIYQDQEPQFGCPRIFGAATDAVHVVPIDVRWTASHRLRMEIDAPGAVALTWEMTLSADPAVRLLNAVARRLPQGLRRNPSFLAAAGRMSEILLRAGRIRLTGTAPSGQRFYADVRELWRVDQARAVVDGSDLGEVGPLADQPRLADFWLPRRGIFAFVDAFFDLYDPAQHTQVASRDELRLAGGA